MSESTIVSLGPLEDIPDGGMKRFELDGFAIVVVRIEDKAYALEDKCSHKNVPLSTGDVDADECLVLCLYHGASFDLETGEAVTLPATRPVRTYDLVVDNGEVSVVLS